MKFGTFWWWDSSIYLIFSIFISISNPIIIVLLDIFHHPAFVWNTQRFGDWILSPSSGGTLSVGLNQFSQYLSPNLAQLSRLNQEMQTEFSLRDVGVLNKNRTMENLETQSLYSYIIIRNF
jgi:hypothetical protein